MRMNIKTKIFSASVLGSSLLLGATTVSAQTLNEAATKTVESNPNVLSEANRRLSVNKTIDQARAGYRPQVDLNLGYGRENTNNPSTRPGSETLTRGEASITGRQMLFDGYETASEVNRTEANAESAGYAVSDVAETNALRAVEVYLNILRRQEIMELTEANLQAHQDIHQRISRRAESGVGRRADVDQIDARLALARTNVSAEAGNLTDAESNYIRVVGNTPTSITHPGDGCCDRAPATVQDAINIAYQQHPALRQALANHEAALSQEQGADAPFYPDLDLEVGATADNNVEGIEGSDRSLYAMFRMNYNLLNGGADMARIEETEFLSEQAYEEAKLAKREIQQDVRLAWNALQTAYERIPHLKARADAAEKTRDAYTQQFDLGQRTLLDLLDSENEFLNASVDYVDAYYDQLYACYWLAETMGQLLESMNIEPRDEAITASLDEMATEAE